MRREQETFAQIEAYLNTKYPQTRKTSTDHRQSSSVRSTYTGTIPAHRLDGRRTSGAVRSRGLSGGVTSLNGSVERPLRPSVRTKSTSRTVSIELVDAPLIRQVEIRMFSKVCYRHCASLLSTYQQRLLQNGCQAVSIGLPVQPKDILIRMAQHRAKWAENNVGPTEVLMVLVLDELRSIPTWSPVRLCDWVALVRTRPLIVRREDVEPTHAQMKNLYQYAYQGSCEY